MCHCYNFLCLQKSTSLMSRILSYIRKIKHDKTLTKITTMIYMTISLNNIRIFPRIEFSKIRFTAKLNLETIKEFLLGPPKR